ncbi:MAG TPA: transglycosylase SLT domain-containing protein [Rhodanobacteraceae bacterium]
MHTATDAGETGGRRAHSVPMPDSPRARRMLGALALLIGAGCAWPAHAALYRCDGSQGEMVVADHTAGYRNCKLISGLEAPRPAHHASRAAPIPAVPIATADATPIHEFVPAAYAPPDSTTPSPPPKEVKANPAVITIKPLPETSAPVLQALPPPPVPGLVDVEKPWPMELMEKIAVDLLPRALKPEKPTTSGSPASPPPRGATIPPPESKTVMNATPTAFTPGPPTVKPEPPKRGAVYKIARADGSVEYTNIASRAQGSNAKMLFTYIITCYACNVHSRVNFNTVALHLNDYDDEIRAAAAHNGISEALLRAVIHAESAFNPRALSYKGAQGLMQLMPGTANDLGVTNAFDIGQNIRGGAQYLAQLLRDFGGNVSLAAAAYNAGEGAVRKYNGVPPFDETQVYVKRVALLRERYMKALHPTTLAAAGVQ